MAESSPHKDNLWESKESQMRRAARYTDASRGKSQGPARKLWILRDILKFTLAELAP